MFSHDGLYADTDREFWRAVKTLTNLPSAADTEEECAICRGFHAGQPYHRMIRLPGCGHVFGECCIRAFIGPCLDDNRSDGTFSNSCPYCTQEIIPKFSTTIGNFDWLLRLEVRLRLYDFVYHICDIQRTLLETASRADLWNYCISQRAVNKLFERNQEWLNGNQVRSGSRILADLILFQGHPMQDTPNHEWPHLDELMFKTRVFRHLMVRLSAFLQHISTEDLCKLDQIKLHILRYWWIVNFNNMSAMLEDDFQGFFDNELCTLHGPSSRQIWGKRGHILDQFPDQCFEWSPTGNIISLRAMEIQKRGYLTCTQDLKGRIRQMRAPNRGRRRSF